MNMVRKIGSDTTEKPVIVLFRHDLRLADNRALYAASQTGKPVIPVFVRDEETAVSTRPLGGARQWWLHHSLTSLTRSLEAIGAKLILRQGRTQAIVDELISQTKADMVLWNRRYDPAGIETDTALKARLLERGLRAESFDGHLLHEPYSLKTGAGGYYRVFTPFWRAFLGGPEPRDPVPAPAKLKPWIGEIASADLRDWRLLPEKPDWAKAFHHDWTPGEEGAKQKLADFLEDRAASYKNDRDLPGREGTSRLSPHLAHGEITPFQIWHASKSPAIKDQNAGLDTFRKEVGWREFSYHLLFNNPKLHEDNFNESFDSFEWISSARNFNAWKTGRTGYPIVDAGMRQLWQTGWMHNRVRMIVASFLIKHLLIDWREGEKWFWDTLVDADPASNAASWQWVAGSGADASPYFRIFNPILQGEKFDPKGNYVRQFVPELKDLPDKYLHRPWTAPAVVLNSANIELDKDYPGPIVEHGAARKRALEAYSRTR
ncbi:deoxyribodipyrimidine photo-lyase [Phyllobacterium ifriqiyense]|uniref:Deoxyribodipyrimidine photo-lyase n=1 Tax=Phyllobacterium ifriqiyense TaxID=314238 RepID=A0ABU0S283_9HYPH|nr:deoxyribodipyrimidine photo-lyase [Phyllobacterium ifriqiyense]MDQ0994842.1 deoxyribodipyrimidine photo-lyase [Phyllobacterium ifriqiyense]